MAARSMDCLLVVIYCLCIILGSSFVRGSPNEKEIEARRRSALDKNFMRFGRTYPNTHMMYHMNSNNNAGEMRDFTKRDSNKETRTPVKNGNFLRFGRAGNNFLRFGRNSNNNEGLYNLLTSGANMEDQGQGVVLIERPQIRASNGYLRFGRQYPSQGVVAPSEPNVLIPAGAIWPLDQQQQNPQMFGQQEEFVDEPEGAGAAEE